MLLPPAQPLAVVVACTTRTLDMAAQPHSNTEEVMKALMEVTKEPEREDTTAMRTYRLPSSCKPRIIMDMAVGRDHIERER